MAAPRAPSEGDGADSVGGRLMLSGGIVMKRVGMSRVVKRKMRVLYSVLVRVRSRCSCSRDIYYIIYTYICCIFFKYT